MIIRYQTQLVILYYNEDGDKGGYSNSIRKNNALNNTLGSGRTASTKGVGRIRNVAIGVAKPVANGVIAGTTAALGLATSVSDPQASKALLNTAGNAFNNTKSRGKKFNCWS